MRILSRTATSNQTTPSSRLSALPFVVGHVPFPWISKAQSFFQSLRFSAIHPRTSAQNRFFQATFSGNDGLRGSGVVSFQCRLVQTGRTAPGFTPCTSPSSYSNLFWGQYNFQVKAVDAAGNVAGSPSENNFTIANSGASGQVR